jgi:hypothetical protein
MTFFELLTAAIALMAFGAFLWAVVRIRDVFHPLAFLMPMVLYIYVFIPFEMQYYDLARESEFTVGEFTSVQGLNATCILALIVGCLVGSGSFGPVPRFVAMSDLQVERVFRFALLLGGISLVAFAINVGNVGGLFEAYSREKGGGTAETGYGRDTIFWSISALALLALCFFHGGIQPRFIWAAVAFGAPMAIHGLLGARRGPTFVAVSSLAAMYYLGRNKRPRLAVFFGGSLALGVLMLLIVSFRDQFRIGSELFQNPTAVLGEMFDRLDEERAETMERTLGSSEFVYGVDVVTRFSKGNPDSVYWGSRMLTIMFIRPIPSKIWENKYEDVGMGRYLVNVGLGGVDEFSAVAYGAAPGFVADLFAEFSWGAIVASFLIGFGYARSWFNAIHRGGLWLPFYVLCIAFSIFLVMQSIEAILFRLLFTAVPVIILWRLMVPRGTTEEAEPAETPAPGAAET